MSEDPTQAGNSELGDLLAVLTAFRNGDFSARMPCDLLGVKGKVADTLNEIMQMESVLTRSEKPL